MADVTSCNFRFEKLAFIFHGFIVFAPIMDVL